MPAIIEIRYFEACGRAQPLRHALTGAGLAFDDLRVPLASWPASRQDPTLGGPYQALPTLRWDEDVIAETLPIATYLARRLGHYQGLDAAAIARLEAVCSCCYLDVTLAAGDLIWADLAWPGVDLARALPPRLARMLAKLGRVEAIVPEDGFLGGPEPVVADYYADEAFAVMRFLLKPELESGLRRRLPRLAGLYDALEALPRLAGLRQTRPLQFTARPDEALAVARLRKATPDSLVATG